MAAGGMSLASCRSRTRLYCCGVTTAAGSAPGHEGPPLTGTSAVPSQAPRAADPLPRTHCERQRVRHHGDALLCLHEEEHAP